MVRGRLVVLVGLTGCGLFPSLDGLSGADAALDAAIDQDAMSNVDGDATSESEAEASAPFCASSSTHTFCADFDEGSATAGWSSTQVDPDGALSLSTSTFTSSPASLRATMARRSSSSPGEYATVDEKVTGWPHVVVDFDVYLEPPSFQNGDINSGIMSLSYFSGSVNASATISVGASYITVGTLGAPINGTPMPTSTWLHVHFDVDPQGTFDAKIGAQTFHQTFAALTPGTSPVLFLELGVLGFNQPAPAYAVQYDNVTMDVL